MRLCREHWNVVLGSLGISLALLIGLGIHAAATSNTARPGRCYSHWEEWETVMAKVISVSEYQDEHTSYPVVRYEVADNNDIFPFIETKERGDGSFYGYYPKRIDCALYDKHRLETQRRIDLQETDRKISDLKERIHSLERSDKRIKDAIFHLAIKAATIK